MDAQWLASRPHLQPVLERVQAMLEVAYAAHEKWRGSMDSIDYALFEERINRAVADVECAVHEVSLVAVNVDAAVIKVRAKMYQRVIVSESSFNTLAGPVRVKRTLYREMGKPKSRTVEFVAMRVGAVEGRWLPRTARAMAHLLAQSTSREAETTAKELGRLPYSRSSFERIGHAVGVEYVRRREGIEKQLIQAYRVPAEATSISVSIDRVAVPVEEPAANSVDSEKAERIRQLEAEIKKQPIRFPISARSRAVLAEQRQASTTTQKVERNYRMAYCATVSLHDDMGNALHTVKYGRMGPSPDSQEYILKADVQSLMRQLIVDVTTLRKGRRLQVVLLADGASELWNLLNDYLNKRTLGTRPVMLVDAWHALEYVAAAARMLEARERVWPGAYRRWKKLLLEHDDGAKKVHAELLAAGLPNVQDADGKRPVADAIRYLAKRFDRMRYAQALNAGLPIGSGTVEATCKSLVSIRMKRPGSRWKYRTGNEVLQLRALQLSDRWDGGMRNTLRPLRRKVTVVEKRAA